MSSLEEIRNRRERERIDARTGHIMTTAKPATSAPAESIPESDDAIPVIVDQTGVAGAAETWMPSDTVPALDLVGDPADGTPAAEATLEFTQDGTPLAPTGLQVKIGDSYDGASVYAKTLQVQTAVGHEGLTVKLDNSTGLNPGASGVTLKFNESIYNTGAANKIGVQLAADPGIELVTGADNGLRAKVKAAGGITRDADGLSLSDHHALHENGGGQEISVAGLSGELADVQPPKIDGLTAETTVADADTFPFYDATATANRKVTAANLKTYCGGGGISGSIAYLGAATSFLDGDTIVSISGTGKTMASACVATSGGGNPIVELYDGATLIAEGFIHDSGTVALGPAPISGSNTVYVKAGGSLTAEVMTGYGTYVTVF